MNPTDCGTVSESELHVFRKKGRTLLFETAASAIFELDEAGDAAARVFLGEREEAVLRELPGSAAEDAEVALKELASLRERGRSAVRPRSVYPLPGSARAYSPMVQISHECNLRCKYCYSSHARSRDVPRVMSRETMQQTARFLAEINLQYPVAMMGAGNELTVNLPLYDEFKAIVEAEGKRRGMELTTLVCMSNLTTTEDPRVTQWLEKMPMCDCATSLDGPPEAHNGVRVYADGTGSYEDVRRGIEYMRSLGVNPQASATFTALHPDVSEVYFHLFGLGFDMLSVKPVRADPRQPYSIAHALDEVCAGYERTIDRLLSLPDEELLQCLLSLGFAQLACSDYFSRFLSRVIQRTPLSRRCEAGLSELTVNTDGKIYNCLALLGVEEACIGSVWEGIDEARLQEITERTQVDNLTPCSECWARYLCGGGCMHQCYLSNGSLYAVDETECALNRHLIELAIWTYAELKQKRRRVLDALPYPNRRPWLRFPLLHCRATDKTASDSAVWSELAGTPPTCVMRPATHMSYRVISDSDDYELEVRAAWNPSHFFLMLTPRNAAADDFWRTASDVEVFVGVPRKRLDIEDEFVPFTVPLWEWRASVDAERVRFTSLQGETESAPGSSVQMTPYGLSVLMPWVDLALRRPTSGDQLSFALVIRDGQGGRLELAPYHQAGRIRLREPAH